MATSLEKWNDKKEEAFTVDIEKYLGDAIDDREHYKVHRRLYDYLRVIEITLTTYYKNHQYEKKVCLPIEFLQLFPEEKINEMIDTFIVVFRESYLLPNEMPKKPIQKHYPHTVKETTRFDGLDIT